jgi:hypothetical protein
MKLLRYQGDIALKTLAAVIGGSQIVLARPAGRASRSPRLPTGFDRADLAVLDWIAAEGRRVGRSFLRM